MSQRRAGRWPRISALDFRTRSLFLRAPAFPSPEGIPVQQDLVVQFKNPNGAEDTLRLRLNLEEFVQRDIWCQIQGGQFYEHELSVLLLRVLAPGDTVFDVGANTGYFTALMGRLVGPEGLVAAFEPNPRLLPMLRHHIAANAVNAEVIAAAIGGRPGTAEFRDNGPADTNGALATAGDNPDQISRRFTVTVDTLDDVRARDPRLRRPKLVKLDIEGSELAALRGAHALLCEPALEFVVCEFNDSQLALFGASAGEIRRLMGAYGFDTYLLAPTGGMPVFVPPNVAIRMEYVSNVLFARTPALAKYWPWVTFLPAAAALAKRD